MELDQTLTKLKGAADLPFIDQGELSSFLHSPGTVKPDTFLNVPLPALQLNKVEPCLLGSNAERIGAALSDPWAVYPGISGLGFGATAGVLAKHYALAPNVNPAERQFKIARAGVIWGLAGFAANYVGGALASYVSSGPEKVEFCQQSEKIDELSKQVQQLKNLLEKR